MKFRNLALLLVVLSAIAIAGCTTSQHSQQKIVRISADEAYRLIETHKSDPNFVVLDIRTPQEYNAGHIENAININFYDPAFKQKLNKLDKDRIYVVYCRTGHRSDLAMPVFRGLGFREVYEINGGIVAWVKAGYGVVG